MNIKHNNKPSKKRYEECPFLMRKNFTSDIGFVIVCKYLYIMMATFIMCVLIFLGYGIGFILYKLNTLYVLFFIGGIIFFISNYVIYKLNKKEKTK